MCETVPRDKNVSLSRNAMGPCEKSCRGCQLRGDGMGRQQEARGGHTAHRAKDEPKAEEAWGGSAVPPRPGLGDNALTC